MSVRQKVGFLTCVPDKPSLIPHFAKDGGKLTRKKLSDAAYTSYNTNTFRVLGEQAEYEKEGDWRLHKTLPRPPRPDKINEPLAHVPYPLKETSVHHIPHSRTASFIRTNVRFINKPVWIIEPQSEDDSPYVSHAPSDRRDFYSASYIGQPGTSASEPIITTYKGDYTGFNSSRINTRHGSNFEILKPAHGIVPVNELREKDGKQRIWEEKMSYRHIYDSRATPNYTFGLKKQGAFVWDRVAHEPQYLPNLDDSPMAPPVRQAASTPPRLSSYSITPTAVWPSNNRSNNRAHIASTHYKAPEAQDLNLDLDSYAGTDDNDAINPQNSVRSEGGTSTAQYTKSELLNEDMTLDEEGEKEGDVFDSKAATALSTSEGERMSSLSKASEVPPTSGSMFALLSGLPTLEVSELTYPDFMLIQRLRNRSHGLLFYAIAHSIYLVNSINAIRWKALDILHPETKYTRKITDSRHPDPLRIAIIGLGRLCRLLIKSLATFGFTDPKLIRVGTRHPERDELLRSKGIELFSDNRAAVVGANIVFVCVPPHMHIDVMKQLNDAVNPTSLVVTFAPPFTAKKIHAYAPNMRNLIKPEYELTEANAEISSDWNCTLAMPEIFEHKSYVEVTCPLSHSESQSKLWASAPVKCGDKLLETFLYAAFNHCCSLGLTWRQTMDCINIAIFNSPCDIDDHAQEQYLKIHDVILDRNIASAASRVSESLNDEIPPPSRSKASSRAKSLISIKNHIDNALKDQKPNPVSLIDVYTAATTPYRVAMFTDNDEEMVAKRQTAFRKTYWHHFRRFMEWKKWNYPPDVSYIS